MNSAFTVLMSVCVCACVMVVYGIVLLSAFSLICTPVVIPPPPPTLHVYEWVDVVQSKMKRCVWIVEWWFSGSHCCYVSSPVLSSGIDVRLLKLAESCLAAYQAGACVCVIVCVCVCVWERERACVKLQSRGWFATLPMQLYTASSYSGPLYDYNMRYLTYPCHEEPQTQIHMQIHTN